MLIMASHYNITETRCGVSMDVLQRTGVCNKPIAYAKYNNGNLVVGVDICVSPGTMPLPPINPNVVSHIVYVMRHVH